MSPVSPRQHKPKKHKKRPQPQSPESGEIVEEPKRKRDEKFEEKFGEENKPKSEAANLLNAFFLKIGEKPVLK